MAAKGARKGKPRQGKPSEAKRDALGRLQKGSSGNPGGQPAWVKSLRDLLQDDAGAARALLRSVIDDAGADMQHRIQAAATVLRYTVPTPKQSIELSGKVQGVAALDEETLRHIAAAAG